MLSAIRTEGRKQVILLREDGINRAGQLREEARQGRLVCEVCAQPVVVRAGEERIWHFAHRPRANCPKAARTKSCNQALPIQGLRLTPGVIPICFINLLAKLTFLVIHS